jgi:hypothetical protein
MRYIRKQHTHIAIIAIASIVVLLVATGYFYYRYQSAQRVVRAMNSDPQGIAQQKTDDLLAEVSRLMLLPTDETPTIATVSDLERLRGQEFFANATVGDKVLIYTKHAKAILYDPDQKKILEVAPLQLGGMK